MLVRMISTTSRILYSFTYIYNASERVVKRIGVTGANQFIAAKRVANHRAVGGIDEGNDCTRPAGNGNGRIQTRARHE